MAQVPRWSFHAPLASEVSAFLLEQRDERFSYAEVGASNDGTPAGYNLDHNRALLGRGTQAFEAACAALREWRMIPAPWTKVTPAEPVLREDAIVAMQARAFGLWWLNACRIVYLLNEQGPTRRFGFAYGTLPAHVEQGEERFLVEMRDDNTVWYDLRAFSRPHYWPVRLGRPWARRLQRRFVRDSQAAMKQAVQEAGVTR